VSSAELSLEAVDQSSCGKSGCCSTSEEGGAMCVVPQDGKHLEASQRRNTIAAFGLQVRPDPLKAEVVGRESQSLWMRVRGGVMFGIACITSPCCTPLIVPVILSLLAGTPAAVWLGANLGWVFGGLTLISVMSLVLGWRWMNTPKGRITVSRASNNQINSSTN
jgi:hypothetical protein